MFAGATMQDVETDRDAQRDTDGRRNHQQNQIADPQAFRRAQDEARDMFERARRSFGDFINRGIAIEIPTRYGKMAARDDAPQVWPALPFAEWKETAAHAAHVDADRRQDPARARAVDEPFLARHALFDGARPDDFADSAWQPEFSKFVFDFIEHELRILKSDGAMRTIRSCVRNLSPHFIEAVMNALNELELPVKINTTPERN